MSEEPAGEAPGATASTFNNNPYCPSGEILCSALPGDTIELPDGCLSSDQQCARDFYSWQGFVSINWPGAINGSTVAPDSSVKPGDPGERVWEMWMDPNAVFLPNAVEPTWTPNAGPPAVTCANTDAKAVVGRSAKASVAFQDLDTDDFFEATIAQPLIDQGMNFVVFEIRMNQQEVEWVVREQLYKQSVVNNWPTSKPAPIFPSDGIEVKAAWRIIPDDMPDAQKQRYYRRDATIVLSPEHVEGASGTDPVCLERHLGLIGFHINHNGLWSTFEQVDNVKAVDGYSPTLYNADCTDCQVNQPPAHADGTPVAPAEYKWTTDGASASLYADYKNVPSQIQRTAGQQRVNPAMNTFFQEKVLAGTVWQHYELITTNWVELPPVSQPIPALNTSLEPYLPTHTQFPQACLDCHELAKNGNGVAMGNTFLVFRACPESTEGLDASKLPPNCVVKDGNPGLDTLAALK